MRSILPRWVFSGRLSRFFFRNIGAHTSSASRAASAHSVFPHYVNYSTRRRQNQPFFRRIRRGIAQKEHGPRSVFFQVRLSPGTFTAEVRNPFHRGRGRGCPAPSCGTRPTRRRGSRCNARAPRRWGGTSSSGTGRSPRSATRADAPARECARPPRR